MRAFRLLVLASAVLTFAARAQTASAPGADHATHHPQSVAAPAAAQVEGQVRKIDMAQGKITLRHGPIPNLDMPGMTMVFKVVDAKLLNAVKEGDEVRFSADRMDGALVVTSIKTVAGEKQ